MKAGMEVKLELCDFQNGKGKGKSSPVTDPEWPRRFQEVKVPRFRDNGTGWW